MLVCTVIVLVQLAAIFFMMAASTRAIKEYEERFGGGSRPRHVEFWHRGGSYFILLPLAWITSVGYVASREDSRKLALGVAIAGFLTTAVLLQQAYCVLHGLFDVMVGGTILS